MDINLSIFLGKLGRLQQLLEQLQHRSPYLQDWPHGGGLYLDYITASQAVTQYRTSLAQFQQNLVSLLDLSPS